MFDGLDTGQYRATHPLSGRRMSCYRTSAAPRRVDNQLQLIKRESWRRLAMRAPAIIGINLDPISTLSNLVPDHADQIVDPIRLLGALRHSPLCGIAFRAVAPGRNNGPRDNQHSRSRDDSLLDCLFQSNV